jgi:hypothetical protein
MNFIKLTVLAATVFTTGIATVKAQSAEEIMDKHIAAIGGTENWNKVKTMKLIGSMSQQGIDISMIQTIEFGKGVRTDISAMGMNGWMIATTTAGWMYMPIMGSTKIDTMKPEMLKMQQKAMDMKGRQMLTYKTDGTKLEYLGKDTINNNPCFKLKITDKDGNESTSFIDCKTYYLLRTESKAKQNDEEMEVAAVYDNYKKLDEGVVMPMSITQQGGEVTFKSIEINKPVDAKTFIPSLETDDKKEAPKQESATAPR